MSFATTILLRHYFHRFDRSFSVAILSIQRYATNAVLLIDFTPNSPRPPSSTQASALVTDVANGDGLRLGLLKISGTIVTMDRM
jgi:hypothetical protein